MLDSSPLPVPPPRKLKRTASAASLPSPPPSVEHLKKRATKQRFSSSNSGDSDLESDEDVSDDENGGSKVVGRKLLFPLKPSVAAVADDPQNPFLDHTKPTNVRDQLALDAASSPSLHHPASPPPSRRKKTAAVLSKTSSLADQRGRCTASELPVLDEENNPFLSNSPPKTRRARSPHEIVEPPTMTYVFKGVKTSLPNPDYDTAESAYERSCLPLSHPDFSPAPNRTAKRLFPEAYPDVNDAEEEEEDESSGRELDGADKNLRTPKTKPHMSKLFVDASGNPLPDSGPEGVRGKTMDASEIRRMAVGPVRGGG